MASGLALREGDVQVSTLIYAMGDQADNILRSFTLSDEDRKSYPTVKSNFDIHFIQRRNVIFECAKFNRRLLSRREQTGRGVHYGSLFTSGTLSPLPPLSVGQVCDRYPPPIQITSSQTFTTLCKLLHCGYGNLHDAMIREPRSCLH